MFWPPLNTRPTKQILLFSKPPNRLGRNSLARFCLALVLLALLPAASLRAAIWTAEALPQYDQLFQRTNDWTGADGDFAVTLTNGLTLWLFSDTFVGAVREGHRRETTMIHNSAAWQHGTDPVSASVEFFHGRSADGKPAALIEPADGKGFFWLSDGAMVRGRLYLFLAGVELTDDRSAFGFRQTGVSLGEVNNPLDPPNEWHVTQTAIPFAKFGGAERLFFGSAVLATDGCVYVYGTREQDGRGGKSMILARVPDRSLADFSAWEFRTRGGWTNQVAAAANLCEGMAVEYSVSWLPALGRYVLICTENGLSEKIILRTAPKPWGPWSAATVVYRCPEMAWGKQIFCYAAKAHPMLAARPDELMVTYAANSFQFDQVINDARLYWPRFVRLQLMEAVPEQPVKPENRH